MHKVLTARPIESMSQDLAGLKAYIADSGVKEKIVVYEKPDFLEIRCPENFLGAVVSLVEKYGYWASQFDPFQIRFGQYQDSVVALAAIKNDEADIAVVQVKSTAKDFCEVFAKPDLATLLNKATRLTPLEPVDGVLDYHYSGFTRSVYEELQKLGDSIKSIN